MPLSPPASRRVLKHTRIIRIEAFTRDDGLWELDARITDVKTSDARIASGIRPAGMPMHDLSLRIAVDRQLTIVDAESASDAVPYPPYCAMIGPDYKKLIGLNLMKGFRRGVRERLAGVNGCTHLTELAGILPTAAIQAFAEEAFDRATPDAESQKPFELDHCHALRTDGAVVAKNYPRWAIKSLPESASS